MIRGSCLCGAVRILHSEGGAHWVPAALLDSDPGVRVAGHSYVGSKPKLVEGFGSDEAES